VAVAGPQRSKLLSTLHKDEECAKSPLFEILDKVYLGRLLLQRDVERFSTLLSKHRHALVDSQHILNVLDMAVIQHNLEACSKLYTNISFSSLARLLQITEGKAQDIVATMIREGRLPAEIDQMEDLVIFRNAEYQPTNTLEMNQVEEVLNLVDRALALAKGLDNQP